MISIDTSQLAANVKAVTAASDASWGNTFRSAVNAVAIAVAFVIAIGLTAKAAYLHPLATLQAWTTPPEAVAAPVKERPVTKPGSKPRPAAVNALTEAPTPAPKRAPRARKKRTLATV